MNDQILAIPGFLGLASDWDEFGFTGIDAAQFDCSGLIQWADQFNLHVQSNLKGRSFLAGYSLGGRLAMHALIQNPMLWKGAIIISAHPGLDKNEQRMSRLRADLQVAERFKIDDWNTLMNDWNGLPVFAADRFQFERKESDFCREHLASILSGFSLGRQNDLRDEISQLPMPILWVVGEKDSTYCQLAQSIKFKNPLSSVRIVPDSGHRVPWEQSKAFKNIVHDFISIT